MGPQASSNPETEMEAAAAINHLRTTPTPTPVQAPVVQPSPTPSIYRSGPSVPVPRAQLAVKRASQVLRVGRWNQVYMPDGRLTWVRFWGIRQTFADLPSDPRIGDAWGVKEDQTSSLWVWHMLPGHAAAAWVDP